MLLLMYSRCAGPRHDCIPASPPAQDQGCPRGDKKRLQVETGLKGDNKQRGTQTSLRLLTVLTFKVFF